MKFAFITAEKTNPPVAALCKVLDVSGRLQKPGSKGKVIRCRLEIRCRAPRVRVPPGQSLASRPVASLAWSVGDHGCEA